MAISNNPAPINPSNVATTLANATATTGTSSNPPIRLVAGQLLNIFVTQTTQNQTTFNLAGQTFKATTPSSFSETGNLQVLVKSTTPSLQLEIVQNKPGHPSLSAQNQQLIQNTLKMLLPSQAPIAQVIQLLSQPSFMQLLPPALQSQLQALINQLLKPGNSLKKDELKEGLQNSGLFLENTLKTKQNPKADLKAQFLQLQTLANQSNLSESTSKLAAVLGQAINKITLQQLNLLESPQTLHMTPPLHPDSIIEAIDIEVRKSPPQKEQKYEVLLNIELPQGELITKLVLDQQDTLSAFIWGETPELEQKISKNLPSLQERFNEAAIKTHLVLLSKAKPQTSKKSTQVTLIDIRI